ncbi:MAG: ABC transporter ATP-binding protein [Campylobacterales bacterium]|jgi:Fe-S cluster assembly ATP-binding protein
MSDNILKVENLHVSAEGKTVIKGTDLSIEKGEVHVLFGPNGSGKSTLLSAIMALPGYKITQGSVTLMGKALSGMTTDEIAQLGVGMSFQHPPAISGVTLGAFLAAVNRSVDIEKEIGELDMEAFLLRDLNVGFSGGELKRAEILKLYAQNPDLLLIDEPESGVDIENIAVISRAVNKMLHRSLPGVGRKKSALIITHTGHILNTIAADVGHVFIDGRIAYTGDPETIMTNIKSKGFRGCVDYLEGRKEETWNATHWTRELARRLKASPMVRAMTDRLPF